MNDINGGLSTAVTGSEFFQWWLTTSNVKSGWLKHPLRSNDMDKLFESWLKNQAVGPNGIAMILAGSASTDGIVADKGLRDFFDSVKKNFPRPLGLVIDILRDCDVPVKALKNDITRSHIDESEHGIKILVNLKKNGGRMNKVWEGTYHNTTPGHSKFWDIRFIGDGLYRATWGKIGGQPLGRKDYSESEGSTVARDKANNGYIKQ